MRYDCEQCRSEVPARHGDELSHLAAARLAAHLAGCASCRAYAARYATAIEAARAWRPALTAARKEAILDRVSARGEPVRGRGGQRWFVAAVSLPTAAALVVLAFVLFVVARPGPEVATTPPPVALDAPREGLGARATHDPRAGAGAGAAHSQTSPAPADRIAPSTAEPIARPAERRPAVVHGARRAARPVEGVAREGARSPLPAPAAEAAPSPAPDAPAPSSATSLYAEAERALAEARPAGAARILEELIERAPDSAEAQAARLELGRLYAAALGHPARAVVHLTAFVTREREPGARGAARRLLCRLLPAAERDGSCWPGLAAAGHPE